MASMQIDVPAEVYGRCDWFVPPRIAAWLKEQSLAYHFTGTTSYGSGQGLKGHYTVDLSNPDDATAFKIQFPDCKVHYFE